MEVKFEEIPVKINYKVVIELSSEEARLFKQELRKDAKFHSEISNNIYYQLNRKL